MQFMTLPSQVRTSLRRVLIICLCLFFSVYPELTLSAELVSPVRLAHVNKNHILVSDFASRSIVTQSVDVLNRGGQLQYILGGKNFHISCPSDIAQDIQKGWVFVSDTDDGRVLVFEQTGALLRKTSV